MQFSGWEEGNYFGIGFDDSLSSRSVRFLCICPEEVMLFDLDCGDWRCVLLLDSQPWSAIALYRTRSSDNKSRGRHIE